MLALEPGASGPPCSPGGRTAKPKAIVIVSAHWESHELLVSGIHDLKPGMTSAVSRLV
jgi:4,5-DOPA dioxygenase extradiol